MFFPGLGSGCTRKPSTPMSFDELASCFSCKVVWRPYSVPHRHRFNLKIYAFLVHSSKILEIFWLPFLEGWSGPWNLFLYSGNGFLLVSGYPAYCFINTFNDDFREDARDLLDFTFPIVFTDWYGDWDWYCIDSLVTDGGGCDDYIRWRLWWL